MRRSARHGTDRRWVASGVIVEPEIIRTTECSGQNRKLQILPLLPSPVHRMMQCQHQQAQGISHIDAGDEVCLTARAFHRGRLR